MLECRGASQQFIVGSITNMQCLFRPSAGGRPQAYDAQIRRVGLDIGFNQSTVLGGCWHPALGRLTRSELYFDLLCTLLSDLPAGLQFGHLALMQFLGNVERLRRRVAGFGPRQRKVQRRHIEPALEGAVVGKASYVGLQTGPTSYGLSWLVSVMNVSVTPFSYAEAFGPLA